MVFKDKKHEKFYHDCLRKIKVQDTYHRALFYVLALQDDTRKHINEIYDFETDHIIIEALEKEWQTAGTYRSTCLAFNLFNGFVCEEAIEVTPYYLFCDENSSYYLEAIKVRYPEYYRYKSYERY